MSNVVIVVVVVRLVLVFKYYVFIFTRNYDLTKLYSTLLLCFNVINDEIFLFKIRCDSFPCFYQVPTLGNYRFSAFFFVNK